MLPALVLTQDLPFEMLIRAGYGRTVSRPEFREMSPATFNDVTGGRQTLGNPDLLRATIDNYDVRWEFYPSPGESISVAGFYKRFHDPIETNVLSSAQLSVSYLNAIGANNVGAELEYRKGFGFVSDYLTDIYAAGNIAVIRSRVEIDESEGVFTSAERPLEGQSPYVLNLQFGYSHPEGRADFAVLYNKAGPPHPRGRRARAPRHHRGSSGRFDIVGAYGLPGGFEASLKVQNILDEANTFYVGDEVAESNLDGRSVSLGLSWKL